jgi:hypothetical protein
MKPFNLIGKEVPRNDAEAKARGTALYVDDLLREDLQRSEIRPTAFRIRMNYA